MSVQAMAAVLEYSEATKGARLAAFSLGNHADKHGVVFLSVRTIAEEAKLTGRAVTNNLAVLRDLGELVVVVEAEGKVHRPPLYWLRLPGLDGVLVEDHPYFQAFGPPDELVPTPGEDSSPPPGEKTSGGPGEDGSGGPGEDSSPPGGKTFTPRVKKTTPGLYRTTVPITKNPPTPQGGDASVVEEIFAYWKSQMGLNGHTLLTPKRRRAIQSRLKEGRDAEQLKRAIDGCAASDFHMKRGRHAGRDGVVHNDLAKLIFRSGDDLERFARMPTTSATSTVRRGPDEKLLLEDPTAIEVWEEVKANLREQLDEEAYDKWIAPLEGVGRRGNNLVLVDSSGNGILSDYRDLIAAALTKTGVDAELEIVDETALELEAA